MATVMATMRRVVAGACCAVAGAVVVAAPVLAAPATPAPTVDQKQDLFMQYLTDHGVPFTSRAQALRLAQSTCSTLGSSSPTRVQDAASAIQNDISMRPEQMQLFAGAATTVFCPTVKIS